MLGSRTARVFLATPVALLAVSAARAVVETIDATVTAQVQEFVGPFPGDSDSAFEDLTETTENLPLTVEANLFRTTGGEDQAGALAKALFHDPRASLSPDPNEFGIDAATFSLASDVSYSASAHSTETREITFLADEIGEPDGTELEARSRFFLDGVLLVWGERGHDDLAGTTADVALSVLQTRPGDVHSTPVLTAGLTLAGRSDGTAAVSTSGALAVENVTLLDLTGSVADFGPLHLVIIPASTALPYVYPAHVGETFILKGGIEGNARSRPGTGAAVQLGVSLLKLALLINDVTGAATGDLLQQIVEAAAGSAPAPAKPMQSADESTTVTVVRRVPDPLESGFPLPSCGNIGIASALLLTFLAAVVALSSRRRR